MEVSKDVKKKKSEETVQDEVKNQETDEMCIRDSFITGCCTDIQSWIMENVFLSMGREYTLC